MQPTNKTTARRMWDGVRACRRSGTLLAILCLAACAPLAAAAAADSPAARPDDVLERGDRVARAVATVTGTAVSPLFGVAVLGAYTYWKTPQPQRASLPFYCVPPFWISMAVLVALVVFKDTVGAAAPLLKKPLDAVEILVVNKAALLFAVLPVVWHEAAAVAGVSAAGTWLGIGSSVYAAAPDTSGGGIGHVIPMVLALITGSTAAVAVWLTGHAIDVLALLSPVPWLDALFKAFRAGVFLIVGVLSVFSVHAALLVSLVIIGVCLMCVWWALRVAVFGVVFAWDMLQTRVFGHRRDPSLDGEVLGFTAQAIGGLRGRSFGALKIASDGSLEFSHRPVGIGFRTSVKLQNAGKYEVGRGFFFPCVLGPGKSGANYRFQFRLLPRYAGYEKEIREVLGLGGVRDLRVPAEVRSAWNWLRGTVVPDRVS